jgi:hypothetical protein
VFCGYAEAIRLKGRAESERTVLLCGHRAKRAAAVAVQHNSHNEPASTRSRHNILVIKWKVASFNVALIRRAHCYMHIIHKATLQIHGAPLETRKSARDERLIIGSRVFDGAV